MVKKNRLPKGYKLKKIGRLERGKEAVAGLPFSYKLMGGGFSAVSAGALGALAGMPEIVSALLVGGGVVSTAGGGFVGLFESLSRPLSPAEKENRKLVNIKDEYDVFIRDLALKHSKGNVVTKSDKDKFARLVIQLHDERVKVRKLASFEKMASEYKKKGLKMVKV